MEGDLRQEPLWARPPALWPAPPELMSFSALTDIEACPHRWALSEAGYNDVWSGRGYPRPLQIASLSGIAVHSALQTIVSALARAGCNSPSAPEAVAVMKQLGGYSAVLEQAIHKLLGRHVDNPRARHLLDHATRTLKSQIPEMRTHLQSFVLRANFVVARHGLSRDPAHTIRPVVERRVLSPGTYAELAVVAPTIGWKARLDLLTLTTEECGITEYKTGAASDAHSFQLKVYALLWYRDPVLNPSARMVTKLFIAYKTGDVPVGSPDVNELAVLEKAIVERSIVSRGAIAQIPPPASPHPDKCFRCHVRQLCTTYWSGAVQEQLTSPSDFERSFGDIDIAIQRTHGPTSWIAKVYGGLPRLVGQSVLLRSRVDGSVFAPDTRWRLLDVHFRFPDVFEEMPTITIGTLSEVFQVA